EVMAATISIVEATQPSRLLDAACAQDDKVAAVAAEIDLQQRGSLVGQCAVHRPLAREVRLRSRDRGACGVAPPTRLQTVQA
ncbi:hypothetical protein C6A85_11035, partial [Mycobacterium sp. ITM-2017-0098]